MKASLVGAYIAIPFEYSEGRKVTFFVPWKFIEEGSGPFNLEAKNLFGVDMKQVLETMLKNSKDKLEST